MAVTLRDVARLAAAEPVERRVEGQGHERAPAGRDPTKCSNPHRAADPQRAIRDISPESGGAPSGLINFGQMP